MVRNKSGLSTLQLLINNVLEALAGATRQKKEIKGLHTGKGETRLSLFVDNTLVIPQILPETSRSDKLSNVQNV